MADAVRVRRAREEDVPALAPLVYLPAAGMYDRIARTRERALSMIAADLRRGTLDATWVAELGRSVVGAMVAYPYAADPGRVRRFLWILLRHSPVWRWPGIAWLHWKGHRLATHHPPDTLYVDALATDPSYRRRGVAIALLAQAEQTAGNNGLGAIALDTAADNAAALALYERTGFQVTMNRPAKPPIPATVVLVKPLKS